MSQCKIENSAKYKDNDFRLQSYIIFNVIILNIDFIYLLILNLENSVVISTRFENVGQT